MKDLLKIWGIELLILIAIFLAMSLAYRWDTLESYQVRGWIVRGA